MNFHYQFFLLLALLLSTLVLSTPNAPLDPDAAKGCGILAIRSALPEIARAVSELVPTSPYTNSRSANTEFGAPTTVGSADFTATTNPVRTANTIVKPSVGNSTITPAPTTESRSANTEIAEPSTAPSTTIATANYAAMMGPVGRDTALKFVVAAGIGMGVVG